MEKIIISKENGKWLVNGKAISELSYTEMLFFDEFIIAMKWEKQMQEYDNQLKQ